MLIGTPSEIPTRAARSEPAASITARTSSMRCSRVGASATGSDNPDPRLQGFLTSYKAKFGKEPDAIAGLAYDAAHVLFQAMQKLHDEDASAFSGLASSKAGSPARRAATAKLREIIAATKGFPGVTGTITLDANRNASKPAVVLEIKDGKKVYNTTVNP